MRKWVWLFGVTALGGLLQSCSQPVELGGSSLETENTCAMRIQLADGKPAAKASVYVRPANFLAGSSLRSVDENSIAETDTSAGIVNAETDDQGRLDLSNMREGRYVVEVRGGSEKAFANIAVRDSVYDSLTIQLSEAGSMSGRVEMPEGVKRVTVGIRGLDYFVQTDSLGNFEFESLPKGTLRTVGFIFSTSDYIDEKGRPDIYESVRTLGVADVAVEAKQTVEHVVIGTRPASDTTVKDTVVEDTNTYLMLDNFEDSTYGWYSSVSKYATVNLLSENAGGKYGLVAHLECSKDSMYNVWTMMGHNFSDFNDFTELDSVVFWIRGKNPKDDSMWVSLSFDVHVDNATEDSLLGYEAGKAWAHKGITTEWTRVVIVPDSSKIPEADSSRFGAEVAVLAPSDSNKIGGNIGWDAVRDHVNSIGIFAGRQGIGNYDIWVDDVEIYGVKGLKK